MLTITKRIKNDHKKSTLRISKANSNMSLYGIKSSWWKREIDVVQIKVL